MTLSDNANLWLATGERCAAAETIFTYATGQDALSDHGQDVPRTLEDFRRCRVLLDQCPELRSCLPRVARLSPAWAEFVSFWDDICLLHDLEHPAWRDDAGKAPKADEMIRLILSHHEIPSPGTKKA